jgi:hypothetical protein
MHVSFHLILRFGYVGTESNIFENRPLRRMLPCLTIHVYLLAVDTNSASATLEVQWYTV